MSRQDDEKKAFVKPGQLCGRTSVSRSPARKTTSKHEVSKVNDLDIIYIFIYVTTKYIFHLQKYNIHVDVMCEQHEKDQINCEIVVNSSYFHGAGDLQYQSKCKHYKCTL